MIPKLFLCASGLYIYLLCVFLQMGWIVYYKNAPAAEFVRHLSTESHQKQFSVHMPSRDVLLKDTITEVQADKLKRCKPLSETIDCPEKCLKSIDISKISLPKTNDSKRINWTSNELQDCILEDLVRNCSLLKEIHQYNAFHVSEEEKLFPLVFSIKMHHRPHQAEQILRTIYRNHNIYCIHVDQRADKEVFELINDIGKCFENVIVIQDREKVIYSSYAHVTSELKCMRAVSETNIPWKYYINLSGQEFPLKTNLEMVRILKFLDGVNDIETYDHPVYENWKIENKYTLHGNSLAEDEKKPEFKYRLKFSKGNAFGLFAKDFIDFVFEDNVAREVLQYLNDTYAPEENVWSTLVTLPWAPGGYPVEVRHMISTYISRAMIVAGDTPKCYGRIFRGVCQYSCGDLAWLKNRPEFFASKFDFVDGGTALHCLEQWYRTKATSAYDNAINWALYNRLPHVKHHRNNKLHAEFNRESIKQEWIVNSQVNGGHSGS